MPPKGTRKHKNTSESEEQWKQHEEKEKTAIKNATDRIG